jgi:hypothetical protein
MPEALTEKEKHDRFLRLVIGLLVLPVTCGILFASGGARVFGIAFGAPLTWPEAFRPFVYAAGTFLPLVLALIVPAAARRAREIGTQDWGELWSYLTSLAGRLASFLCALHAIAALRVFATEDDRHLPAAIGLGIIPVATALVCWRAEEIAAWWRRRGREASKDRLRGSAGR